MDAVRCPDCGDVRWSFFGFSPRAMPLTCEVCEAEMVPERRRPMATKSARHVVERRGEPIPQGSSSLLPPAA